MIKSFTNSNDDLQTSISIGQYNQELNEAMKRTDKGHFTTIEQLEKEMETW
jgi:hypothetical protein